MRKTSSLTNHNERGSATMEGLFALLAFGLLAIACARILDQAEALAVATLERVLAEPGADR